MSSQAFPPFRLVNDGVRQLATAAVWRAPEGWHVTIKPPTRSGEQNRRLHAMLSDIAKSGKVTLANRVVDDIEDLKCLFVSAWRMETKQSSEIVEGLHGEPVQLRRSTASMSKEELGELMTVIEVFAAERGIKLRDSA